MKSINFYLVTDTHYFENNLGAGGEAFEKNMVTEQYFVKESHAIVSSVFDKIIEDFNNGKPIEDIQGNNYEILKGKDAYKMLIANMLESI